MSYGQGFETPTFAEIAYRPDRHGAQPGARSGDVHVVRNRREVVSGGEPAHQPRGIHGHDRPGNRDQYGDRRAHDVSQREQDATAAASRPNGMPTWARRIRRARQLHVPARRIRRSLRVGRSARRHDAGRFAAARRAAAAGVRRAGVDARRVRRIQRRRRGAVRRAHLRQRRELRVCAGVHAGQCPRRLRAGRSDRFRFSEYVRCNNIANVNYVGSVIVGDTNGRYYEPVARPQLVSRE